MIVASLVVVFFRPWIGVGMSVVGWIFQFVGHAFEGKAPAFFPNPVYLLGGPAWIVDRLASLVRGRTDA